MPSIDRLLQQGTYSGFLGSGCWGRKSPGSKVVLFSVGDPSSWFFSGPTSCSSSSSFKESVGVINCRILSLRSLGNSMNSSATALLPSTKSSVSSVSFDSYYLPNCYDLLGRKVELDFQHIPQPQRKITVESNTAGTNVDRGSFVGLIGDKLLLGGFDDLIHQGDCETISRSLIDLGYLFFYTFQERLPPTRSCTVCLDVKLPTAISALRLPVSNMLPLRIRSAPNYRKQKKSCQLGANPVYSNKLLAP